MRILLHASQAKKQDDKAVIFCAEDTDTRCHV